MNRRDFLSGIGASGYSLMVLADLIPPARAATPGIDEMRRAVDRVSPPGAPLGGWRPEPHMRLVNLDTDVLIAGGGLAGVCAALAAARHGARVVLVQDRSRLGGNSSSEVKMHVVGANCHTGRPGWREGGILEELRLQDAVQNPQRCWEMWDFLLYDKVVSEPNITLLLESVLYNATVKNGALTEALVRCDKSEHIYRVNAKVFCDCTGDSRLGLEAAAEMREGREARAEFNEPLAPEKADKETLGSSILFTSRLYHKPMPFKAPAWARKVTSEHLKFRGTKTWEYGYWWIEWGGNRDIVHDNERIRFELLSIVVGVWDYIKNSGDHPDSDYWALDWIGMMPGKRGGRRLVGDHILTQHDLLGGDFPDAVALGGWPMDDHPPGGFDRSDLKPNTSIRPPEVYNIPLRSLYSKNVKNLFMAGRNISATHVAFTSTRVMATCAVEGQAIGTAAAICVANKMTPRQVYQDRLGELQQTLLRDDQSIRGLTNQDARDLARKAQATASSGNAAIVLDGHVRDIPKKEVHHWEAPLAADGAWLELAWDRPQRIAEVQITFDTGFQRQLTLSSQDSVSQTSIRAPQPETVKAYKLLYRRNNQWTELAKVEGNYQRLNRHRFDAVEAEAIRVHVTATNGDENARIFEIRCYA